MGLFDHKNLQVPHLKDNKTCRFNNGFRCLYYWITDDKRLFKGGLRNGGDFNPVGLFIKTNRIYLWESSSSDELRAPYRKEADFSRKRYGRFLQKERTFVQKGTDFLPKRNAPFRRKTDRNKKNWGCNTSLVLPSQQYHSFLVVKKMPRLLKIHSCLGIIWL